ncbi:type II toxin-antitoxin system HicB family antitoxin [Oxalobacteraceae bacterium CAVE-383]|nr:type II toxin-antitoxin system HicB family antitoxin [Oxalobacteraceae bacterium CAVE-383]
MKYPATFTRDRKNGGFVVTFRDIPEAITQGDTEDEAMEMARDVLTEAMSVYFDEKRAVPLPSAAKRGDRLVDLPASISAKVLLLNEMLSSNVWASELARRMDTTPQEVSRLIDLKRTTKIDRIEQALAALGKQLTLIAA